MNFYIKEVVLWLNNNTVRKIEFFNNKVNVILGASSRGKTDILNIIDYCFFASRSNISESIVNENVAWYGLSIVINDKGFVFARMASVNGIVSDQYYFSTDIELPPIPSANMEEPALKS